MHCPYQGGVEQPQATQVAVYLGLMDGSIGKGTVSVVVSAVAETGIFGRNL